MPTAVNADIEITQIRAMGEMLRQHHNLPEMTADEALAYLRHPAAQVYYAYALDPEQHLEGLSLCEISFRPIGQRRCGI